MDNAAGEQDDFRQETDALHTLTQRVHAELPNGPK